MKKLEKIFALILALALCLSLFGCGKKNGSGDDSQGGKKPGQTQTDNEEHPDFVYVSSFTPVSGEIKDSINSNTYVDGRFLCSIYTKIADNTPEGVVPEWEGQYWEYGYKLLWVDLMGNVEYLENYTPIKALSQEDDPTIQYSNSSLSSMCVTPDGSIYTLDNLYTSRYTGPTDVEMYSDEFYELGYGEYEEYTEEYYIRKLDADGSELALININEEIQKIVEENGYFYPYNFVIDNEGNFYLSGDGGILVLDSEGTKIAMISGTDMYVNSMFSANDGSVMVIYDDYSNPQETAMYMAKLNITTGTFEEPKELQGRMYNAYPGGGDYDLYFNDGSNFFGYDMESGEKTKLFNWINVDVDSYNTPAVLDDGRIVCFINTWDSDYEDCTNELAIIEKKPYDSVPHKTELTYACQYLDYMARSAIIQFNKNNDEYRIMVNDYSEYNTDEDYNAGMTKLTTEILGGKMPDIIQLSYGMPVDRMEAKGLLADLYPLLDADGELSRDSILSNVLTALENDGKLYRVASTFGISTVIGNPRTVGDTPGWTVDDFKAALATMPEGCTPFEEYVVQSEMLQRCLSLEMDNLIDWSTGKCYFDTEVFTDILEFVGTFRPEFDWENYEGTGETTAQRIASGQQMLTSVYLYDFWDYQYNKAQFGNEITFIGMPTSEGVGNTIEFNETCLGISSKCANPEAAWKFVRTFLTKDYQTTSRSYGFCTNKEAFDQYMKDAMTPEYQKDENGNYVLDENGNKIEMAQGGIGIGDGTTVEIYALTQEEADQLMELLTSTTRTGGLNQDMIDVITQDSEAYFVGDKTAEEVGRLLQSKMSILVNEQR